MTYIPTIMIRRNGHFIHPDYDRPAPPRDADGYMPDVEIKTDHGTYTLEWDGLFEGYEVTHDSTTAIYRDIWQVHAPEGYDYSDALSLFADTWDEALSYVGIANEVEGDDE